MSDDSFDNAVFLFCHGVWLGGDPRLDESWILLGFQRDHATVFVDHVQGFCRELSGQGPRTLGVISGGQSRPDGRCYLPESISYHRLARESHYFDFNVADRQVTTEWFATDSFTNMLFSFGRFWELTGKLPRRVTAISFNFKQERITHHFETCVRTMGAADKVDFTFLGVGNPPPDLLDQALASEARTLQLFRDDPFGVRQALAAKQGTRNPYRRQHPYAQPGTPLEPVFAAMRAVEQQGTL